MTTFRAELTQSKPTHTGHYLHFYVDLEGDDMRDLFARAQALCPKGWKCTSMTEDLGRDTKGTTIPESEFLALPR